MNRSSKSPTPSAALRRRAESRLRGQQRNRRSGGADPQSDVSRRLLHELQVHQVELEMQNGELKEARDKLEALLEKYSDLYDFAPVGYLTLERDGAIREANLAGASLLGVDRSRLAGRRFGLFVAPSDRAAFNAILEKVFAGKGRKFCELELSVEGKPPIHVQMPASACVCGRGCRVAMAGITARKRTEKEVHQLNTGLDARVRQRRATGRKLATRLTLAEQRERTHISDMHGLNVKVTIASTPAELAEEISVLLYQSVRELLFNIVKHSGTKSAWVTLRSRNGRLETVVRDAGRGFHPASLEAIASSSGAFGLSSVRERLALLGGRMDLEGAPGRGSRITLRVPLGQPGQGGTTKGVS